MNICNYIPRALRVALLNQPIPESWKSSIERSLGPKDGEALDPKINLTHKHNYKMIAALCILFVSGFIIFVIIT